MAVFGVTGVGTDAAGFAAFESIQAPAATTGTASVDGGAGFATQLTDAVDEAQRLSGVSNELAIAAVTGDLTDIHDATIAAARSSLTLEVLATMRNRGVEAFNEIMRMQA
jgi:flagellar hook-basal body complex protein FliE